MARILIADDELEFRALVASILESDGHEVVTVDRGDAVIEALLKESPDLMIMDVMMPGMDGFSVQSKISEHEDLRKIPVIVVTAQVSFLNIFEKFDQVVARLDKVFEVPVFRELVRKTLERRTAGT
ncbi:two-component system response regulator [Elusimicrobiota bacterium]